MKKRVKLFILASCLLLLASICSAQYQCTWNTFGGGGGAMASTNYLAGTTIGQTAIGTLTSTNYQSYIGFWQHLPIVGIAEEKNEEIFASQQLVTRLYSAKPNPFKTQTAIRYSLSAQAKISLLVYDINGRTVNTLINETRQPGIYSTIWNGRNERGQKVSSGIYFYKLQTPNYYSTKKILLIE